MTYRIVLIGDRVNVTRATGGFRPGDLSAEFSIEEAGKILSAKYAEKVGKKNKDLEDALRGGLALYNEFNNIIKAASYVYDELRGYGYSLKDAKDMLIAYRDRRNESIAREIMQGEPNAELSLNVTTEEVYLPPKPATLGDILAQVLKENEDKRILAQAEKILSNHDEITRTTFKRD